MMQTILISNGQPPDTYTPNSFLILLQGLGNPPSDSNFGEAQSVTGDSLIIPFNRREVETD